MATLLTGSFRIFSGLAGARGSTNEGFGGMTGGDSGCSAWYVNGCGIGASSAC